MLLRMSAIVLIVVCTVAIRASSQTPAPPPQPGQAEPSQPAPDQPPPDQPAPAPPSPPEEPAPQAVPAPPPTKIIPGVGIAGIHLGASTRALRGRFGLPTEVLQRSGYALHLYGRFGLIVYVRNDVVAAVATTNSLFRIGRSLGVGQPAAGIRSEFGAPTAQAMVTGFPGELYDQAGVGFGIERSAIAMVIVFRPGEARQIATVWSAP